MPEDRRLIKLLASREETVRRLIMLIALYAIPAVLALGPINDPDLFWHLRTGQWIVAHGTLPATDPFSAYGIGKPWIVYSWLWEVLIYGLYHWLGLTGILVYRMIMSVAVAAGLHYLVAKREPRFATALGIVGLAMVGIAPGLTERPWLFTVLFVTLTLDTVLDCLDGKRTKMYWLLPVIYAVWANIHIQFIYGLLVLGLACVAQLLDPLFQGTGLQEVRAVVTSTKWRKIVVLAVGCAAATLLNPYHVHLYSVIMVYASQHAPFRYIQELTAPDFRHVTDWAVLAIAGTAAFALGRRRKFPTFEVLLLIASAYFAFRIRRDVWFVVTAALVPITTSHATQRPADRLVLTPLRVFSVVAAVLAAVLFVGRGRGISEEYLEAALAKQYPVKAAAAVEQHHYSGPLYNNFDWGGYLIWRLQQLPVAMDGRTNVHGDNRIERSIATWSGANGWSSDPELNAAGVVISRSDLPLASLLRLDPRFQVVYEDSFSVVFVPCQKHLVASADRAASHSAAKPTVN